MKYLIPLFIPLMVLVAIGVIIFIIAAIMMLF